MAYVGSVEGERTLLKLVNSSARSLNQWRSERQKRGDRIRPSGFCKTDASEVPDAAVKDLIDNLIVPRLVEEFISQYGPVSVVKGAL